MTLSSANDLVIPSGARDLGFPVAEVQNRNLMSDGVKFFPSPDGADGNGNPESSFKFPFSSFEEPHGSGN
jgi:hypothetical protein